MKIVCSSNMPYVEEAFSLLGDTVAKDGRAINAEDVRDAEVLAIRSTTKVNRALLEGSAVKFVGTATIGTDHFDKKYMDAAGIKWCYSPGCNANSVSEYITAALLSTAGHHGFTLEGRTIGVVGVGNVGKLVVQKAVALGMKVLQNDPPRERAEGAGQFVSLDQLLEGSDIVTMHVPLTKDGMDPTFQMADSGFFEKMKEDSVFLNAARGPVVNSNDLLAALSAGKPAHAVIDTWEGEPSYRDDVMGRAEIGTPHTAGYSFEGKVNGTVMVYRKACEFLGVEATWTPDDLLPPPLVPEVAVGNAAGREDEDLLREIVENVYDIRAEDARLRDMGGAGAAAHFDALRKGYPVRREFRFTSVSISDVPESLLEKIRGLGFNLLPASS